MGNELISRYPTATETNYGKHDQAVLRNHSSLTQETAAVRKASFLRKQSKSSEYLSQRLDSTHLRRIDTKETSVSIGFITTVHA